MISLDKRRLEHPLQQEPTAAAADANAVIEFVISYDPQLSGMSTRLTAVALSNEGEYLVANVGDSRTYLHRAGRLRRLTRDQSPVEMLIDRGVLSEEDARRHPHRSVVLEALDGVERPLPPLQREDDDWAFATTSARWASTSSPTASSGRATTSAAPASRPASAWPCR